MVRDVELLESAKAGCMGDQGKCDQDSCPLYDFSPLKIKVLPKSKGKTTDKGVSEPETPIFKSQNGKETIVDEVTNA